MTDTMTDTMTAQGNTLAVCMESFHNFDVPMC